MARHKGPNLVLAAALLLCALIMAYGAARYIVYRRVMHWRSNGIAAAQSGRHREAVVLLERYLDRRPSDVAALECYAISRQEVQLPNNEHLSLAAVALKALVRLRPGNMVDQRRLVDMYLKLDRQPEALDAANVALAGTPGDAPMLGLKVQVLERMGQPYEALGIARKWVTVEPDSLPAQMMRLSLRCRLEQSSADIVADAERLRLAHPGDGRFELLEGFVYAQVGSTAQAGQWLRAAAVHTRPADQYAILLLSQLDSLGLTDDSLRLLQDWAVSASGPEIRNALARRLWEQEKWPQVADLLGGFDEQDFRADPTLIAFKAMALARVNKLAEAAACRAVLAKRQDPAAAAWFILLGQLIDAAPADDKLIWSQCQKALARDPHNLYLVYYMGEACARLGEDDAAVEALGRVVAQSMTWSLPAVRLAELLMSQGRLQGAIDVAAGNARRNPGSGASALALARAWAAGIESGRTGGADELLRLVGEIQKVMPGDERTLDIQVQMLCRQKHREEALKVARDALAMAPPPSEQFLLTLSATSRRFALGLEEQCFAISEQAHGLTATLAYARAVHLAAGGQAPAGRKLFDELARQSGLETTLPWRMARAQYLDMTGDSSAREMWIALADENPADISVQQAAASAIAVRRDWDIMPRVIDRLRQLGGDKAVAWQLARARLMVEAPRDENDCIQASVQLTTLIHAFPRSPEPHALLAEAMIHMKRFDAAIGELSVAAQLDPASITVALKLAGLLQSRGDFERVRHELERIPPELLPEQRLQTAMLLAQEGQTDRAIRLLEPAPGDGEPAHRDLFLAITYQKQQQFDKVDVLLPKLLEKPDLATVMFAVSYCLCQGRRDAAEQALGLLDSMTMEAGMKELARGSCYIQLGDLPRAIQQYHEATRLAPANPVTWRALAASHAAMGHITQAMAVVADGLDAMPSDAGLLILKHNAECLRQAGGQAGLRDLVVSVLRNPQAADSAIELIGMVIDGRRGGNIARCITRLQEFAQNHPDFPPARIQLARCYWDAGRLADATTLLQQTTIAFPSDIEAPRLAVALFSAAGRYQDMLDAAQAWRQRATGDVTGADMAIARARIGLKQFAAAIASLEPYLPRMAAEPDRYLNVAVVWSSAMVNSGASQQVVDLLWPLVQKSPGWRQAWIDVGLHIGEKLAAAAWLDRVAPLIEADAVEEQAALAEAYDRLGSVFNDEVLARKGYAIFTQLGADPQAPVFVLLAAATHAEHVNDLAAAEAFYRRVVAADASICMAQNNLAMLIVKRGGDLRQAAELGNAALAKQPQQASFHDTVALIDAKTGNFAGAVEQMRAAMALEPDNAKWQVRLAQYLLDGGDIVNSAKVVTDMLNVGEFDVKSLPVDVQRQFEMINQRLKTTQP